MNIFEGDLQAGKLKFGIVVSRFNDFITSRLVEGAVDTLVRHGASENDIEIYKVPGAFEIPVVARQLGLKKKHDALICLGTVIRGGTPHFEYVAGEVSKGIASASMETMMPMAFGVLTTDSIEQAIERAGTKSGNKGAEAAASAIEMARLLKKI